MTNNANSAKKQATDEKVQQQHPNRLSEINFKII